MSIAKTKSTLFSVSFAIVQFQLCKQYGPKWDGLISNLPWNIFPSLFQILIYTHYGHSIGFGFILIAIFTSHHIERERLQGGS